MPQMRPSVSLIIALLWSFSAFALAIEPPLAEPAQEARAQALFTEIRCMVCQSETIADSHAQVAADMRRSIRESVSAGISDEKIKSSLAGRYGDVILMKPPLKINTILLWFGPWMVLGMGAVAMYFYFRNQNPRKKI